MTFEYECEICGQAFISEESIEASILCADCLIQEKIFLLNSKLKTMRYENET